ncbi:NAD(P)-binding protein [Aspergillus sclerotioniger CBS 115572]|uniref:NAD(P)-binding protein n=1 Tax=Aspergillus sclerotioniger CBS 115572 TaxID=1450535 RepID=A0A317WUR5_9EURO|nr:NAD(P)-binding protein [Aspergillus sclerotioniger CBS 115572]PWY88588.1 NAD(P)-binding protein [Aspergillus sclerotioniger CBS 115572]
MSHPKKVLVTCATGNQGRGVVQHCLAAGHQVCAYVRDPTMPTATQLAQWGATLVPGNLDDLEALRTAMHGVDAVFLTEVQTGDCEGDLQRSSNVILAAQEAAATVTHVIVSTAIKTGQHASFPGWGKPDSHGGGEDEDDAAARAHPMRQYWLNKHTLETRVRAAAAASSSSDGFIRHWTIVRPGHYLQNLLPPVNALTFPGFEQDRILRVAWWPQTQLPWVDAGDVGIVVAVAITDPERYSHRAIDLAVEALTVEQLAGKLDRALSKGGVPVSVEYRSEEEVDEMIRLGNPVAAAQQWANQVPGGDAVGNCRDDLGTLVQACTSVDAFLAANASRL